MKRSIYTLSMLAAALTASAQTVTLTDGTQLPDAMKSFTAMPTLDKVFVNNAPISTYAIKSIELLNNQQLEAMKSGLGKLEYVDNANDIMVYRALATPLLRGSYSGNTNYAGDNNYCYATSLPNAPINFIVPTDEAFKHYIDVYSLTTRTPAVVKITYNPGAASATSALECASYGYDPETGATSSIKKSAYTYEQLVAYTNRLLMSHTVLGDLKSGNRYYRTLDGNVICVEDDGTLHGTYQLEDQPVSVAHVVEEREITAGGPHYYITNSILTPQPRSAFSVILNDVRCEEFFKLWNDMQDQMHPERIETNYDEEDNYIGPEVEEISTEEEARSNVFVNDGGTVDHILQMALLAPNTPYTMFVPSNEAILAERATGRLDTWRQKRDFILYHICYGSEFADKLPFAATTHRSALVEGGTLRTPAVRIASAGNGDLTVTDVMGNTRRVVQGGENIFTYEFGVHMAGTNQPPRSGLQKLADMKNVIPAHVAPGVVHIIDGVLRYN